MRQDGRAEDSGGRLTKLVRWKVTDFVKGRAADARRTRACADGVRVSCFGEMVKFSDRGSEEKLSGVETVAGATLIIHRRAGAVGGSAVLAPNDARNVEVVILPRRDGGRGRHFVKTRRDCRGVDDEGVIAACAGGE